MALGQNEGIFSVTMDVVPPPVLTEPLDVVTALHMAAGPSWGPLDCAKQRTGAPQELAPQSCAEGKHYCYHHFPGEEGGSESYRAGHMRPEF